MRRLGLVASLLSVVFSFILPAFSQGKHPFTFEDMMKLKRVGEPVPSPDGKWVLFSVVDVDLAANKKTPHIWIVPLAGGQEREIIADQDGDRPRWAPDGKRFAFISNKEGGAQVWIAEFDGAAGSVTALHRLTSIATEAGGELWSPDGKTILFTSDAYPECDGKATDELTCNERKHKEVEESKVKAIIFDRLLYRHWNAYKRGTRTHIFVVGTCQWVVPPLVRSSNGMKDAAEATGANGRASLDRTAESGCPYATPRDLTPGDHDAPVFSLGGQDDYAFSPDGSEICYASNHEKMEAASTNNDLWTVPVNWPAEATPADVLAKTKNITAENPASDSTPLYSPDGKYIAYRAQSRPGYESDRFRLMLYDRKTGEKKNLTEDFDRWVGTFVWGAHSAGIFFIAEEEGEFPIYGIHLQDLKPIPVLRLYAQDDVAVTPAGENLVFTEMSVAAPNEIYTFWLCRECRDLPPPPPRQLSHLNDAVLSQVSMSLLEPFWFTGAHGDKVEGFLVKPPNFDASKKYPVKFLIHGGPEGAWGDDWSYRWNPELFAAPTAAVSSGYVVIMINFHGSTGYGQKFVDAINGDWGGAPFEDLMKGLDYAEKTYPFIDKDRECALGASYGGYAANWVLGHTDRFKCIVSHDGMFNAISAWGTTEELWFNEWEYKGTPYTNREMYDKWSPSNYAKNFKTPTLVVHGQLDYRLDVSEGFQLFTTLQTMGVPSKMLYFPDEGHWVLKPQNSQLWWKTVNDWVDQWVGGQR